MTMKRNLLILLFLVWTAAAAVAQYYPLHIENLTVEKQAETVVVSFFAATTPERLGNLTLAYIPVITDGQYRVSLPAVVLQDKRAFRAWSRHEWAADTLARYENAFYADRGNVVDYQEELPFQYWMHGARVELETVVAGCGNSHREMSLLQCGILPALEPVPVLLPEPAPTVEHVPTIGERLAEAFSFVLPASEFDLDQPLRFYDDERDNALTIYYKLDRFNIEPDYADNHRTLMNLLAAIRIIRESYDAEVERVIVAGFTSPEGTFAHNDRLAWERAVSIKEYILKNTDMPDRSVHIFNGSSDWQGLRLLVQKDRNVPDREQVLRILEMLEPSQRLPALRQLNNGAAYRYLSEYIFPKLRNGAFIRVYYNNLER